MMRSLFLIPVLVAGNLLGQNPQGPVISLAALEKAISTSESSHSKELHGQVLRLFGKQNLLKGKPTTRIEGTSVAWAIMDPQPALVQRADGTVIGSMTALGEDGLQVLVKTLPNFSEFQYQITTGGMPRVGGMVHVEHYDYSVDSQPQKGVPVGKLEKFAWKQSRIFPDTVRDVTVYIPQQYQPGSEACLMVWQDGSRHVDPSGSMRASVVFDNLIHKKDMPVTIGVFVDPGRKISQKQGDKAANRSLEYDSLGDAYVRFLLDEILPEVQKRYGVKFRPQPAASALSPPPGSARTNSTRSSAGSAPSSIFAAAMPTPISSASPSGSTSASISSMAPTTSTTSSATGPSPTA
jgi:hypothetical protein